MKLPELGTEAKKNGISDTNQFGFNLDAHSFELLSKSLYSNPILAMLRELTTNAIDSLKESGNVSRGYEVHLPNNMEPFWSIRDRGLGIPKEKIVDLFTFNKSSKSNSDSYNGMFGLGSKSWLAVSDSSTWTSYYNRKKCSYFVFKDKGIPTYTIIDESETDEENGVEIKIPIERSQFYNIIDTYKKFCRHVEIQPTIIGYDQVQWDNDLKTHSTACISLGDNCWFDPMELRQAKLTVVFGSVAYPVNINIFKASYRHNVVMHIPIGSVDIVPSREELRMTEKTIKYLNTLAPRFETRVQEQINDVYKTQGFIGACTYVNTIFRANAPKINDKEQFIKLNVAQSAKFNYNNVFKYVAVESERVIDINTRVILNFEQSLPRYKARLRHLLESPDSNRNTIVVLTSDVEAKKYCEHFEVDIATLTHLKDVVLPKKVTPSNGIKNDRFTGIRTINYGRGYTCTDVDLSKIETMFFVYRNGNNVFADKEHTREIENIQVILGYEPWNNLTIYALTSRQYKQCAEYGFDMVNLMDDVNAKYDEVDFDEQARRDILIAYKSTMPDIPPNILDKLLPPEFASLVSKPATVKTNNTYQLYRKLGYGQEIHTKHQASMSAFNNSDVGKLILTLSDYKRPSAAFISKLMAMVINSPELIQPPIK